MLIIIIFVLHIIYIYIYINLSDKQLTCHTKPYCIQFIKYFFFVSNSRTRIFVEPFTCDFPVPLQSFTAFPLLLRLTLYSESVVPGETIVRKIKQICRSIPSGCLLNSSINKMFYQVPSDRSKIVILYIVPQYTGDASRRYLKNIS